MKECLICLSRQKLLKKLRRRFKKDLQTRDVECVDLIGLEFLYLKKPSVCPKCEGGGWMYEDNRDRESCTNCEGTGRVLSEEAYISELEECPKCKSAVATVSSNFNHTKHIHRCECGWKSRVYEDINGITW